MFLVVTNQPFNKTETNKKEKKIGRTQEIFIFIGGVVYRIVDNDDDIEHNIYFHFIYFSYFCVAIIEIGMHTQTF